MSWTARLVLAAALVGVSGVWPLLAHRDPASIVIVTGQEATAPVPTLIENSQNTLANQDVADQLFLRLADVGPGMVTAGDQGFVPMLARSWSRRDSLTLVFDLDPRARWHDGAPVTSRDVLFTLRRARDSAIAPRLANVTRRIASVEAEGEHRVVFRFRKVYAEQLYDATFHAAIVPAHLLEQLPATPKAWAEFAAHPVGSGPYRWVRRQPGEFIELAANEDFFLGAPAIKRLIVRVAVNPDARLNLLLAGEADATENIPPPITNIDRVKESKHLRVVPVPSSNLGYLLFNQRNPADTGQPHPILADRDVRRALILALDRPLLVRAVLGRYGDVPFGPASSQLWIHHGAPSPAPQDQATARRLLSGRGWVDRDQDGVRENRSGAPLALDLQVIVVEPAASTDGPHDPAAAPRGRRQARRDPARARSLGRAPRGGQLRHQLLGLHPGPLAERAHLQLDLRRSRERRPLLRPGRGLAALPRHGEPHRRPRAVAPVPPPGGGGRTRGVPLRSDLRLRCEPALSRGDHPAGLRLGLALAVARTALLT